MEATPSQREESSGIGGIGAQFPGGHLGSAGLGDSDHRPRLTCVEALQFSAISRLLLQYDPIELIARPAQFVPLSARGILDG